METTKVLKLALKDIPSTSPAGHLISDPIGSRINRAYEDPSMAGYLLVAAYETVLQAADQPEQTNATHLMLYFQKP